MLVLPRLNSDHRHARVDKQPGHKGDGDTLSPPALLGGLWTARHPGNEVIATKLIASWFTFQRCLLTNVAVGLASEHINLAPRVQSQVESWPGIRGARCHPGCEQAPNGFSQARGRLQQEPELFCPVGSSSPFPGGNCFTAHCRQ